MPSPVAVEVAHQPGRGSLDGESDVLRGGDRRERVLDLGEQQRGVTRSLLDRELPGVDGRHVDEVTDQSVHAGGVALDLVLSTRVRRGPRRSPTPYAPAPRC